MPMATAGVPAGINESFTLEEIEVERPQRGEVHVRIVATGLSDTDLSAREGLIPLPLPGVLGSEAAGAVEGIGNGVNDRWVRDLVVLSFTFCGSCRTGHPAYRESGAGLNCVGGSRADGTPTLHRFGQPLHQRFFGHSSLATRALAQAGGVVKAPRDAPLERVGPLPVLTLTAPRIGLPPEPRRTASARPIRRSTVRGSPQSWVSRSCVPWNLMP